MITKPHSVGYLPPRPLAVVVGLACAFLIGTADAAVNGLTPVEFTNTGVVTSSASQFENNVTNNSDSVVVLPKALEISKAADVSGLSDPIAAGDEIVYTITAKNLGLLGLTGVTVDDSIIPAANISLVSGDTDSNNILDANEIWQWQGIYPVQQSDIDTNGGGDADIDNTVTVSSNELPPLTESVEVSVTQAPAFAVTKAVDQSSIATPATLAYVIEVTNTGNQTLSNVVVSDTLPDGGTAGLNGPLTDTGQAGLLDPGEIWRFETNYIASQADIDSGSVLTNTVSVVAAETGTTAQTANASTTINTEPQLLVTKVVDQETLSAPGTLSYTITIENTGNVSLTGVNPTDTLPDGTTGTLTGPVTDTNSNGVLDVAESWTYNISYVVTQAVLDAGNDVTNRVEVVSNETGATPISADATTVLTQSPAFVLLKSVDEATLSAPGLLSYSIELQNTGNVTLTNVALVDALSNGTTLTLDGPIADAGLSNALDVGETWEYTASYTASQADIDLGADIVNVISVATNETDPDTATAVTSIESAPALAVTKTVDQAAINAPGTLSYVIEITNVGNLSLNNVQAIDTLPDGSIATLTGPVGDEGEIGTLDVGESWQYSTSYAVGQTEIDEAQPRVNTVSVTSDETGSDPFTASATTTVTLAPAFTVTKTVDQEQIDAPSTLAYVITVTNTGNNTLTDITIDDVLPDGTAAVLTGPTGDVGVADALDVGEVWTYTASFDATQDHLDAGETLINSVTVSTAQAGAASDTAQTTVNQQPAIALIKAAVDENYTLVGDIINYAFLIQNQGNLQLSDVVLTDANADIDSIRCLPVGQPVSAQLSAGPFDLAPGEQMNCTAVHTVVLADIDATQVDNQATVSSVDPQGNSVTADSAVVTVPMLILPPLATDDSFNSDVSAVAVTLPAGANDTDGNNDLNIATVSIIDAAAQDTDGDGDNDSLTVTGEGTWLVDNTTGTVTFTPEPGFTADPTPVNYTVSDRSGAVSNIAVLSINYPQTAPQAKDDLQINPAVPAPTNPTVVNVLADNGNGVDSDPENDLDVGSIAFASDNATDTDADGDADNLTVPGEGVWQIDNNTGNVIFTPEAGFFADPTPVLYTISDINGLVSNEATITVDYPQSAPLAVDDERLDQPLAQPVTLAVVDNDSDPEGNLDPTTVRFVDPVTGARVEVLPATDEGLWRVDVTTGEVTFTPDAGFITNPTPVAYSVLDSTNIESNLALITITFEPPVVITGTVWLDTDRDGQIGADEQRKPGWTLNLLDSNNNFVASTVTDENGDYQFIDLIPGEYTVEFFNQNGVFMDSAQTLGPVLSGQTVLLPLPVDPSGVVYDSIARTPVEGVTLNLVNASGVAVDALCLRDNQQGQTTLLDGLYAFDVIPDAHATCSNNEIYRIEIASVPAAFRANFSTIIRQEGAASCGSPEIGCAVSGTFDSAPDESFCTVDAIADTSACEVQAQPDAPQVGEDTRYFVEFALQSGDQNVIFNHIPIDARANDAEILLTKVVDQNTTSIGSLVTYTVTAENLKQVPGFAIEITDTPPAGFGFVVDSALLSRAGLDGELNTSDDLVSSIAVENNSALQFESIDFEAEEIIQIKYVLRVGTGVIAGRYSNRVSASGPNGEASNEAVAEIDVVADTVISQATLIGKVFWDRDQDGIQDPASVSGLKINSAYYGTLDLNNIPARSSVDDDPSRYAITLNMPVTSNNSLSVQTREGTRIEVDHNGTVTSAHIGARARGTSAQDIRVCTRQTVAEPSLADGTIGTEAVDVLEITIANLGIGEVGIPGARLATTSGLIITTDGYGRYSIPDVESGDIGIGSNFILKVDPSSLPDGASFTTENPYVLRIDGSALNRMNFGVLLPPADDRYATPCEPVLAAARQVVEVQLGSVFFDTDDASIREDQRGVVADIIKALRDYGGGDISISAHADNRGNYQYNLALAERRAATIRQVLSNALGDALMRNVTVEVDPAAYQESGQ